jgi:hypothetical protein
LPEGFPIPCAVFVGAGHLFKSSRIALIASVKLLTVFVMLVKKTIALGVDVLCDVAWWYVYVFLGLYSSYTYDMNHPH